jgi:ubiquinol-cytochrome c reductase iron-sulfur subunit
MSSTIPHNSETHGDNVRRDFLYVATGSMGAVTLGASIWPLIDALNPSADVLSLSSVEIDLSGVQTGQRITIKWRGRPVFIYRRSEAEISAARADDTADLRDPEPDSARVQRPEWLVVIGICTHLGCVPSGQGGQSVGNWGGWFCPCHGSHYDLSGRIRKGPAPRNLDIPPYAFLDDTLLRIG